VKLNPLDWLLVTIAALAVIVGVFINPPICILALGHGPIGCIGWRFPFEIASGVALAAIVLTIVAIRSRRRSS